MPGGDVSFAKKRLLLSLELQSSSFLTGKSRRTTDYFSGVVRCILVIYL